MIGSKVSGVSILIYCPALGLYWLVSIYNIYTGFYINISAQAKIYRSLLLPMEICIADRKFLGLVIEPALMLIGISYMGANAS